MRDKSIKAEIFRASQLVARRTGNVRLTLDPDTALVAAQSAVAEAEFEDGRPPMRARGWRKAARNTAPPAVAGEEKPPLKMPHSQPGKMWATSATFSGIGDGERHKWAERYKDISTPKSKTRPVHWLE